MSVTSPVSGSKTTRVWPSRAAPRSARSGARRFSLAGTGLAVHNPQRPARQALALAHRRDHRPQTSGAALHQGAQHRRRGVIHLCVQRGE
ncbi:hypothetical protein [Candidatus Accumulibacter contiguus]|uniref:hypothetical protein n=1 Tax=Candidatus Accumulibacter contiguus TaxID=2954381 RepID=UPI00207BBEFE|nr:hypothetical protein [Candidatus Accumulibacter contiguus]